MKWLKAAAPSTSLPPSFKFTVFGLGNRQYEHYNKMGKLVNEKLELAGGTRVYRHGEGDDDGNLEEDFDAWRSDGLWTALHAAASHAVGGASAAASGAAHAAATGVSHGAGSPPSPAARTVSSSSNSSSGVSSSPAPLPWKLVPVPAPSGIAVAPGACAPLMPPTPAHLASAASADLTSRHFFTAGPVRVHSHRELRQAPGVGFSTLHVELDLDGTGLSYRTADTAHVLPENDPALVEAVARWLNYKLDDWFTLEPRGRGATAAGAGGVGGAAATGGATADDDDDDDAAPSPLFPTPTSVRTALTRYVDLSGLPRKDLLLALAPHAKLAEDRKRLLHLGGREGKADWAAWAIAQERSVAELFSEFPSLAPPLEAFLQLAPRLQPRPYTIASSNVVAPSRVALCASVLDSPKPGPDGRRRLRGVCSNTFAWVMAEAAARSSSVGGGTTRAAARQQQQQQPAHDSCAPLLRVLIRPSTFHLPADASRPIILVGPGTGVAPMRAFCQEREALRAAGVAVGPTVMFFGCRKRSEDYVYRDEIAGWAANGTLSALHVAFSRDAEQKVGGRSSSDSFSLDVVCSLACYGTHCWVMLNHTSLKRVMFNRTRRVSPYSPCFSREHCPFRCHRWGAGVLPAVQQQS